MDDLVKVVIAVALIAGVVWISLSVSTGPIEGVGDSFIDRGEQTSDQGSAAVCRERCEAGEPIPESCYDIAGFSCSNDGGG